MRKNYCEIHLVRHGQTDWNAQGLWQGHTDIPLNAAGEQQAREIAEILKHEDYVAIFSSDLLRAKRTAEIIKFDKDLAVQTTMLLRERRLGIYEGEKVAEIQAKALASIKKLNELPKDERSKHPDLQDLESDDEAISRLITFFREVAVAYANKKVLVVSHGGVLKMLLRHLGWASEKELGLGTISNAARIVLETDGVDFFVEETYGIKKTN